MPRRPSLSTSLAIGFVIAGLCVWIALRSESGRGRSAVSILNEEKPVEEGGVLDLHTGSDDSPVSHAEELPVAAERRPAEPRDEASPYIDVEGRFVLRDEEGPLWGEVKLRIEHESYESESQTLVVDGGHFQLQALRGSRLVVEDLELIGAPAVPLMRGPRPATDDYPILIHVRRPPRLVFHVVDAALGFHLDQVTALIGGRTQFEESFNVYPGQAPRVLFEQERSPIRLDDEPVPSAQLVTVHIGSPGYAWARLSVDLSSTGEHAVELAPGASVEIFLEGAEPPRLAQLHIWRGADEGSPDTTQMVGPKGLVLPRARTHHRLARPGEAGGFLFEGLHAGEHVVRLDFGYWRDAPTILARTTFEARPDEPASVVLTLNEEDVPRLAPLTGTLVLPEHWRQGNEALALERFGGRGQATPPKSLRIDDMERVSEDVYLWDAGQVLTGKYELFLPRPYAVALIDVGPEGVTDARLEIAPPGELVVDIVDHDSGKSLEQAELLWQLVPPAGARGRFRPVENLEQAEKGRFQFMAPIGEIELLVLEEGYAQEPHRVQVLVDRTHHTLRAQRKVELRLELRSANLPITVAESFHRVTVERIEQGQGQGEMGLNVTRRWEEIYLAFDRPGRYRLTLPKIQGYRASAPQVVEVRKPGPTVHVVDLVQE